VSQFDKPISDPTVIVDQAYKAQNDAFGTIDYPFLIKLIDDYRLHKILDIGTGEGTFIIELAKRIITVDIDAIDINKNMIDKAKINNARNKLEINFYQAIFDASFPQNNYDLIIARFALEHIIARRDIDKLIATVYANLKTNGWVTLIEYFILDVDIIDPTWKKFRKSEIITYKHARAHPRICLHLPVSLRMENFHNIKSNINHVSPSTIGADNFFNLVFEYTKLYSQIYPIAWPQALQKEIFLWCDRKQAKGDPAFYISHTIGQKLSKSALEKMKDTQSRWYRLSNITRSLPACNRVTFTSDDRLVVCRFSYPFSYISKAHKTRLAEFTCLSSRATWKSGRTPC